MSETGPAPDAGLVPGSRIAGYLLEQQVGRGPTGVVFRARDEQRGQIVALKIIGPPFAADQAFAARLLREVQAAAAVGEPHILPVLQAGEAHGKLFLAMPFINGADARSMVRREGVLSPQRAAPIVWRVASALDAAHAAGLVHGDVKPANVFVESQPGAPDLVYLSDFGQGRAPASSPVLAGTGLAGQALDCIAPEQADGKQADGRADQYALACVAFELLTGEPPFRHDDPAALAASRPEPPRVSSLRPGLPAAVDNVLGRALAQVVAYRYPNCREFADALHAAFWPDTRPGEPAAGPPAAVPAAASAGAAAVSAPVGGAAAVSAPVASGPVHGGTVPASPFPGAPLPGGAGPAGDTGAPFLSSPGAAAPGPAVPGTLVPGSSLPGSEPWLVHGRRRRIRIAPVAFLVVAVLLVAGLVTGLLVSLRGGHAAPVPKPTALHIAATSGTKRVTGYVWTVYGFSSLARAQISGSLKGAVSGEVARLYAQQFPFNSPPARVGAPVRLHPSGKAHTASFSFSATPTLATRYRVEVFHSRSARTALAKTATTTVYVASGFSQTSKPAPCSRPVCHETISGDVLVPAAAMSTEISKPVQVYFAFSLAKKGTPPLPATLQLGAGDARASVKLLSASEYQMTVTFAFSVGKTDGYNWGWNACTKDTEAEDGMGLPGSHGCGDPTIPDQTGYLG